MGAFQEFPQVSSGLFNEQKNCFFLWLLVKVLLEIVKSCIFQVTFDHLYFCTIQCMKIAVNHHLVVPFCLVLQVEAARLYTKYSARPGSVGQIPFFVEKVLHIFDMYMYNLHLLFS